MIETPEHAFKTRGVPLTSGGELSSLDRFLTGPRAELLSFLWGFAEATFFFLVPDVFLTLVAVRALRHALRGTVLALAGALAGGAIMYAFGVRAPGAARSFLDHVPGISSHLIATVETQINRGGLLSILFGPARGIPYKIYAAEWGAATGDFVAFMLISIPARYVRFFITVLGANLIARMIARWTRRNLAVELTVFAVFWVAFYSFYFSKFGF